ncbi:MAG: hypothetical protein FJ357_00370 [Thaumarchaeota archaeon]|nr:hypothetical protein [Nitrososphaerota archaeon]
MKISGYVLLGILVVGGFGIFGFVVGESFEKSATDKTLESVDIFEQGKTNNKDFMQSELKIKG